MTIASKRSATTAGSAPPQNGFSLVSDEKLLALYSTVLKCRMLGRRIRILSKQGRLTRAPEALGQEAAAAGVGLDLHPGDTLAPSPHGFIPCFVKGLPVDRIFSVLSSASRRARSPYAPLKLIPPSLSLAAQLDRAIGAAITNKAGGNRKIAVAFCGNSSASPGLLREAMRRAGQLSLPILLVCHSNPGGEEICLQAQECGFPGVTVDGDDAVAVYRVATEAIAHARRGSGPTLIECRPWPLSGRKPGQRRTAANPALNLERYLIRKALFDRKFKSATATSFRRELDAAIGIN
jgi:pyruvate dehydrogenase E1 component alpha subunit